jgi:type II secretory pathway component GspD/PulD (secretin)
MTRALAICALVTLINSAAAETPVAKNDVAPQPTVALPAPVAASACGKADCPEAACESTEHAVVETNSTSNTSRGEGGSPDLLRRLRKTGQSPTSVETASDASPQHALLKQKLAEMNCLQSEIEELRRATGTPEQVHINMQVLELSRTKARTLGLDAATADNKQRPQFTALFNPLQDRGGMRTVADNDAMLEFIESLRGNGVGRVLANPSLMVCSGRPCSFRVGGDVPVPSANGSKSPVDFVRYGTDIDVVATVIGEHRVRLDLRARVSEIDETRSLEVEGERVPALSVRQIDTAIELGFGQTGILSGFVQRRQESIERDGTITPTENEIELLFLVTPDSATKLAAKSPAMPSAK